MPFQKLLQGGKMLKILAAQTLSSSAHLDLSTRQLGGCFVLDECTAVLDTAGTLCIG